MAHDTERDGNHKPLRLPAGHRPQAAVESRSLDRDEHPLLSLQRMVGNRAVQRLVARDAGGTSPIIQRVLSSSTAAMGRAATGDLLSQWAGVQLGSMDLQQGLNTLNAQIQGLLNPISMVQAALAIAEREPAPRTEEPLVPESGGF